MAPIATLRSATISLVAGITGEVVVNLAVTDAERSGRWYASLLGMVETSRYTDPGGRVAQVCLRDESSGLELCLVGHGAGEFDEHRTGLDHLELIVADHADLAEWSARLDELGIGHSGVKQPEYSPNAMITFRDPDNIQLEFFCRPTRH